MLAHLDVKLLPGEAWWGGAAIEGAHMPYADGYAWSLADLDGNQGMPLLLSSLGRLIWSEEPFRFARAGDRLELTSLVAGGQFAVHDGFATLRDAFRYAARTYFPSSGAIPDPAFFSGPQYNLWIEQLYAPTQAKVLAYAEAALTHGFPPGVLMIDTLWSEVYGTWRFHAGRFPDPAGMVSRLHALGFKVMVWVVPYVTADTLTFRDLRRRGFLIKGADGEPAICPWWDGYSALLDVCNPDALDWLEADLKTLMAETGVDGFKLDAGQPLRFAQAGVSRPHDYTRAWNRFGLRFPLAEYKDCWRAAGLPLAQRTYDRAHSWDARTGLGSLIPIGLAQGLTGHAFICPDMIGGGEYQAFPHTAENLRFVVDPANHQVKLDKELFVRYAQCSALFPMMQFSAAPWRLLDARHLALCRAAADLHVALAPKILALARESGQTGEPILRHLSYDHPGHGYEHVTDQFMLGDEILVAPVLTPQATHRRIVFPPGSWLGDDGSHVVGATTIDVPAPLERLPWYRRE